MAVAALAMASCSKDETTGVKKNDHAIEFNAGMGTRATEINTGNLNEIWVTGFSADAAWSPQTKTVYDEIRKEKYTKETGGSGFRAEKTHYWPSAGHADGQKLQFFAWAPEAVNANVTTVSNNKSIAFTTQANVENQYDLVTAQTSILEQQTSVPLTFGHRLSQIEFHAKNTNSTFTAQVTEVHLAGLNSVGTYTFGTDATGTGAWSAMSTPLSHTWTIPTANQTLSATAVSLMNAPHNLMVIPQDLSAAGRVWDPTGTTPAAPEPSMGVISLNATITSENGTELHNGWISAPFPVNLEMGKKYTVTIDVANGGYNITDPDNPDPPTPVLTPTINFTVTVTDWTPVDQDINM